MTRVLVLSPHPDDESLGCGGTLCSHVANGDEVRVVFLTSGEAGGHGRDAESTRRLREQEAAEAASILGVTGFEFWHAADGALAPTAELISRLGQLIDASRADLIYTTHAAEDHPDHRAAAALAHAAMSARPDHFPTVYQFEIWTPLQRFDHIVDITRWMDSKLRAVRAYRSQCAVVQFDDAVEGLNRYRGELHCWPEGTYAEVFARMTR